MEPTDSDIKSAAACADAIAFARINGVFVFDLKDNKTRKLDIQVRGDLPGVRPRLKKVGEKIHNIGLSPAGARVVFESRGEILTAPAEKGDAPNLTITPVWPIVTRPGHPTAKRLPTFPMNQGSTSFI